MKRLKGTPTGSSVIALLGTLAVAFTAAQARADSLTVHYYNRQQMNAASANAKMLVESRSGRATYQVIAAQREHEGQVEVHQRDTDIIYVIKGAATLETGGTVLGARRTGDNEMLGQSIHGGVSHRLGPGDLIVVPHGVPHWFKQVQSPVLYLVIKVR